MSYLLCRNRVADFSRWKTVFSSHAEAHREAGLELVSLWRSIEEPDNVYFPFKVASMDGARQFINHPEAAKAAEASGVVEGEYHFLENMGGYR